MKQKVKLFAGVHKSRGGKITPTGVGRICNWTPDIKGPSADSYPSFGAYQRSLTLKCEEGEPGIITWTPDQNTPDTVYYQCFTHRYLGWKINVLDSCDLQTQASDRDEVYSDVEAAPSIRHESKIAPSENFLQQHEKDLIKHHNMNGGLSKNPVELQKNEEFNRLITDGIKAAEALEETITRENFKNGTRLNSGNGNNEEEKDLLDAIAKIPQVGVKPKLRENQRPLLKRPQFGSSGIPVFLRPPQNVPFPFYPNKLPPRVPIAMERRPPNRKPISPYLLPQQSIMVNHYKKPSFGPPPMPHRPPYLKNKIPQLPPKPLQPVLLLGQPTEIKSSPYKKSSSDLVIGRPSKQPIDISPAFLANRNREREPQRPLKFNNKNNNKKIEKGPVRSTFKDPFDIRNEPVQVPQHSNTGFKADTIIVESGFRPIRREDTIKRDDSFEESGERISGLPVSISRRSDNFEDAFEAEEEPQSAFFEPMFIPSPPDSVALPLVNKTESQTDGQADYMVADSSDRQDIFYLPPNESKRSAVTYDAKAILDTSLLNDPLPSENDFVKLSSKTKQFIKDTPQFAPFTGEIPTDLMLQISANRDQLSKERPALISTKLSAVRTNDGTR